MNNHLSIISLLLLLFYMMWFMWDQNELIKTQHEEIRRMQEQIILQNLFINETYRNSNQKLYNNKFNQI